MNQPRVLIFMLILAGIATGLFFHFSSQYKKANKTESLIILGANKNEPVCEEKTLLPCQYWIQSVEEYCDRSRSGQCDHWKGGEKNCLSAEKISDLCKDRVEKSHQTSRALYLDSHMDLPVPEWLAFYDGINGLRFEIHYSKEFIYRFAHPDLPFQIYGPNDLSLIVSKIIRDTIKPEYNLPIIGLGMDFPGDDHSHNELLVNLNFTFVPKDQLNAPLSKSLLVISYDLQRRNSGSSQAIAPMPEPLLARVLVVDDTAAFKSEFEAALGDTIMKATHTAICFRKPDTSFCDQFFASYMRGKTPSSTSKVR